MGREVGITTVLNQINTPLDGNQPRVFQIGFIRKTGKERGTFKSVNLAKKHSRTGRETGKKSSPHLKSTKTLLLDDETNKSQPFYVGIETIIEFNGARVRH